MNKDKVITEFINHLKQVFEVSKAKKKDERLKYRTEGFLHAMRYAGIIEDEEASQIIESVHVDVFGETFAVRKARKTALDELKTSDPDAYFDIPTIERM